MNPQSEEILKQVESRFVYISNKALICREEGNIGLCTGSGVDIDTEPDVTM